MTTTQNEVEPAASAPRKLQDAAPLRAKPLPVTFEISERVEGSKKRSLVLARGIRSIEDAIAMGIAAHAARRGRKETTWIHVTATLRLPSRYAHRPRTEYEGVGCWSSERPADALAEEIDRAKRLIAKSEREHAARDQRYDWLIKNFGSDGFDRLVRADEVFRTAFFASDFAAAGARAIELGEGVTL